MYPPKWLENSATAFSADSYPFVSNGKIALNSIVKHLISVVTWKNKQNPMVFYFFISISWTKNQWKYITLCLNNEKKFYKFNNTELFKTKILDSLIQMDKIIVNALKFK